MVADGAAAPTNLAAYYGATYYGSAGQRCFPAVVEWLQCRLYAQRAGQVARAVGAAWFHLDVPRHLHHFPEPVLRAALERRGLRVESETSSAPEYDAFSLVQTWQNRLGLPQNLLYLILKRVRPREASPAWQRFTAMLLAIIQFPAAAVITWFRGRRREGAVVVFLARKSPPP